MFNLTLLFLIEFVIVGAMTLFALYSCAVSFRNTRRQKNNANPAISGKPQSIIISLLLAAKCLVGILEGLGRPLDKSGQDSIIFHLSFLVFSMLIILVQSILMYTSAKADEIRYY